MPDYTGYVLLEELIKCKNAYRLLAHDQPIEVDTVAECYQACLGHSRCKAFSVDPAMQWCHLCDSAELDAHEPHEDGLFDFSLKAYAMVTGITTQPIHNQHHHHRKDVYYFSTPNHRYQWY